MAATKKNARRKTVSKRKNSTRKKKQSFLNIIPVQKLNRRMVVGALFALIVGVIGIFAILQTRASTPLTFAEQATAGLDPSGKTLPAFDYQVPTSGRVIYMAPADRGGKDTNTGLSLDSPVETITAAYQKLKNGGNNTGTIVLRGGEYRSWYSTDGKIAGTMTGNITFQAYRSEKPWFVGADPVKDGWTQAANGTWKRKWSTPNFCSSHLSVRAGTSYRTKVPRLDGAMVSPVTSGTPDSSAYRPYSDKSGISMSAPRVCAHPDTFYTRPDRPFYIDSDPQQVVSNGAQLSQKKTLAELASNPNSFYYDWDKEEIYVNKDPIANTLELSKRHALVLFGGATKFQWKGIGVKHFASSPLHAVIYAGLGGAGTPGSGELIVENSVFAENSGNTIDLSGPKQGSAIRRSVFASNSYTGFGSNGFASSNPGASNSLTIEASIFNDNNKGNMDAACTASCGSGGVKLNNMTGYTVKNSIFENTNARSAGLWCDIDCSNAVMVNNVIRNNGGHGIFYEISSKGIIANNLVHDNGFSGIAVFASDTKVYNNTVINKQGGNVQAFWIMDDDRPAPDKGETWPYSSAQEQDAVNKLCTAASLPANCKLASPGPNTNNVHFVNNLVVGQRESGARLMNFGNNGLPYPPNTLSNDYFSKLDYNAYYHQAVQNLYLYSTTDKIKTPAELQRVSGQSSYDRNAIHVPDGSDPFVSRTDQDFRLKTNSLAFTQKGAPLPTDVATAMDQEANVRLPRGVQFPENSTPSPDPQPEPAPNSAPTVSLGNVATTYTVPTDITLTASASDPDGSVAKVEYFRGSTKIGESLQGPTYQFVWRNVPAGTYTLTAKATDDKGASTVTTARSITVNPEPAPVPVPDPEPEPTPEPVKDTTLPTVPSNLARSLRVDWGRFRHVLDLKWQPSTDNVGVTQYQIQRNSQVIGTSITPSFVDATVEAGADYRYSVRARDAAGNFSNPTTVNAKVACFLIWCWLE